MAKRYYVRNTVVPFEEDFKHEFKGHRNICLEDLPPWTQETKTEKPSRRAVSRALNAFLNTGKGGTVYLGVIDSGIVKGLQLSSYQENQDEKLNLSSQQYRAWLYTGGKAVYDSPLACKEKVHVLEAVHDVMGRYMPPVKSHRYSVKFVPVYDNLEDGDSAIPKRSEEGLVPLDVSRHHELRQHTYCWCDRDAVMQFNAGIMLQEYIIEIKIKPWDDICELNQDDGVGTLVNIHPIHEDEEGNCFFRRQASLVQYTMSELARLTRQEVEEICQQKIASLKREIAKLQKLKGIQD